jgi:hypothetical protein
MEGSFFAPVAKGDGLKVRVRLQPSGPANRVLGLIQDVEGLTALKVSVTQVPEGGKANAQLIKLLAKEWKVAKSALEVIQGHTSRNKVVTLAGDGGERAALLQAWSKTKGFDA